MIGLDTNILVRYLTHDDPIQSPKAAEIIERRRTEEKPGFVCTDGRDRLGARTAYRLGTNEIATVFERMLQTDVLVVENEQEVLSTMIALKDDGQGSFADAVIRALGARAGCFYTLTFDPKALRLPGFEIP